jgi:tetratricopeptide (TPR) repeat protein
MKLILITLVAVVVGMMVACSSETAATSTPSYPQISEDESVDSLKQILKSSDKAIQIDPNDYHAYVARGGGYGISGQYQTAIDDFDRALQIDPDDASAYFLRGLAYSELGQYQTAISDFTKVIEIDPHASAYVARGLAYEGLGQLQNAHADEAMACSLDSDWC